MTFIFRIGIKWWAMV